MKIRTSHQTLPDGWQLVPLSDVATVQTGLALGREATTAPVSRPYLRVANVQDGYLDLTEVKSVVVEQDEVTRYSLLPGDVLMTEGGDFDKLGRGHIWRGEIEGCLHQNHVFAVRPKNGNLIPEYLANLTSSEYGRRYFLSCSKQSTNLASINSSQLKAFPIPLPPLPEQRAIAAVLSAWDRAIRQTTDLIAAKRRIKQGLMQQLLTGKRRFPGFAHLLRNLRLRDVTEECSERNRQGLGTEAVMAVTKADGIVPMRERLIGADLERYKQVRKDWFAYNPMRINIGSIARSHRDDTILVSPDYVVFRCREETLDQPGIDPDYLDHLRKSDRWASFVTSSGNGSVRVRIYYDDLGVLPLQLPSMAEQRKIASLLNALDCEITLLTQQLTALKTQKKGLMRKLLTGEVRVKVPS